MTYHDPEQERYAPIIFLAGFVSLLVFVAMLLYLAVVVMEAESLNATITRQQCMDMYFGDESETGYVESLAAKCWNLLR